ncbi:hypothetical protein AArcCO_1457 [Halalkaliarchaeum sp. AArc-CO]|uniref:hypothetical protein n=1 Tax=Halalkaliarchaeum sp. AArc-CO TaxID=2866381 RepID=UPI00217E8568|nr:hypothetical protein [Halalkaliarchaeum sp. AArc-CO]UWG50763.1 hypothetical protein AArcCO_1457 [Halalkaliarchaeum sp. AArc-CO]
MARSDADSSRESPQGSDRGRHAALAIVCLAVGVGLMANPLYLPVAVGQPTAEYVHTVQPADASTPDYGTEPIAYEQLPPDAQELFEQTRESRELSVADPDDRIDRFAYPDDPSPNDGFYLIEYDGETYELWTRTIESDGAVVLLQRLVVQPAAFLLGFFAVFAGGLLARRAAS